MAWTAAARAASLATRRARAKGKGKVSAGRKKTAATSRLRTPLAATSRRYKPGTRSQRPKSQVARSVKALAKRKGVQLAKPASSYSVSDLRRMERHLKTAGGGRVTHGKKRLPRRSAVGKRGPAKRKRR